MRTDGVEDPIALRVRDLKLVQLRQRRRAPLQVFLQLGTVGIAQAFLNAREDQVDAFDRPRGMLRQDVGEVLCLLRCRREGHSS